MQPESGNPSLRPSVNGLPTTLPEGYYLENFEFLLRFVIGKYSSLLNDVEIKFAESFQRLPSDARKLFVRLSNRKGEFFRVDKLSYSELSDLDQAIVDLVAGGFVLSDPEVEITDAVSLLTRAELQRLKLTKDAKSGAKRSTLEDMIFNGGVAKESAEMESAGMESAVTNHSATSGSILGKSVPRGSMLLNELGLSILVLLHGDIVQVFQLLFFGNFHQNMTEFVLHELVSPFESYDLSADFNLFSDRAMLDEMIALHELSSVSHDILHEEDFPESAEVLLSQLGDRSDHPLLARRYDRIVNRIGRQLERCGETEKALEVYQMAEANPSRERRARILATLSQIDDALAMCHAIAHSPADEEEYEFALGFGTRLARKHAKSHQLPVPTTANITAASIELDYRGDAVELDARDWYLGQGRDCHYVENSLMRALFGLAFWDIIFAPVKGAFFNPFQRAPADIHTPEFSTARSGLIEARFAAIEDQQQLLKIVLSHYKKKKGLANQFVHWPVLDHKLINCAIRFIPASHLGLIFRRLLTDLGNNSSGFPDLIVFEQDSYELVEVKGPGDRLQKNQTRWFRYFEQHKIPASVLNVVYKQSL